MFHSCNVSVIVVFATFQLQACSWLGCSRRLVTLLYYGCHCQCMLRKNAQRSLHVYALTKGVEVRVHMHVLPGCQGSGLIMSPS